MIRTNEALWIKIGKNRAAAELKVSENSEMIACEQSVVHPDATNGILRMKIS